MRARALTFVFSIVVVPLLATSLFAELVIAHTNGSFDYRDRARATISNLSIRPVPVSSGRDNRLIQFTASYTYKNRNYVAHVEEMLHDSRYESLEDSSLYSNLKTSAENRAEVLLDINPANPEKPRTPPDLMRLRYLVYPFIGFFAVMFFSLAKGRDLNEEA